MQVTIVENTGFTPHGQIGVALHEAGAVVTILRPHLGQPLPADLADQDALVVFGGEQSALADDTHPYLGGLAALMRQTVEAGKPVMGVCLGSQLMARGFGARNEIGTAREFGWTEVTLNEAGRRDPVLGAAGPAFPIFQWHSDTFTLPDGAVHLARSGAVSQQAFRVGRAGYATQFHFEAHRAVVEGWTRRFGNVIEKLCPDWPRRHEATAKSLGPAADRAGIAIARAFVARIGA